MSFLGKSTFLDHYQKLNNVAVYTEPVDKWRDLNGHNLLQLMYEQPERHSYTFQSYVQLTMAKVHTARTNKPIKIIERSLWSARYVFAENLLRSHKMAKSEFEVLNAWFEFLQSCPQEIDLGIDLVIYLRTSPEVAYQRLKERARPEEKIVPLEYLQELHNLHEEWLKDTTNTGGGKILVIDADKDIEQVPDVYSEHESTILQALKKHPRFDEKVNMTSKGKQPLALGNISNCI